MTSFTQRFLSKTRARTGMRLALLSAAVIVAGCNDDDHYDAIAYDSPNSVAVTDMNNDGVPDIVFAATHVNGSYPNPGFAGVILQNASARGTFQPALTTAVGFNPSTLAIGNLDSASGPDVAVSNFNSGSISVLLHDASATNAQLQTARDVLVPSGVPYDVAIGDLNNDGLPDLAVADAGSSLNVTILLRSVTTPGTFSTPSTLVVGYPSTAVAIADVNGDGRNDLVVANTASNGAGRVSIFIQSGTTAGTFLPRVDVAAGSEPLAVKVVDVNGDGRRDIVVANEGSGSSGSGTSGVSVLLQSATTPGTFLPAVTYATARGSVSVDVGDLNSDGLMDLVVANTGGSPSGTVSVLLQDATRPGNFLTAVNYRGMYEPLGVAIGNLNGDALPDIVVADGSRATVMFNSSTSPGTFAAPVSVGR